MLEIKTYLESKPTTKQTSFLNSVPLLIHVLTFINYAFINNYKKNSVNFSGGKSREITFLRVYFIM